MFNQLPFNQNPNMFFPNQYSNNNLNFDPFTKINELEKKLKELDGRLNIIEKKLNITNNQDYNYQTSMYMM